SSFWFDRAATAYRPDKWDLRGGPDRHALAETNVALTARHIGPQSHRANRRSKRTFQSRMSAFGGKADINSVAEVLNFFRRKNSFVQKRAQWWDSARKR